MMTRNQRFCLIQFLSLLLLACLSSTPGTPAQPALQASVSPASRPSPLPSPDPAALIQPSDLIYLGAFRLPEAPAGTPENAGWEWSGHALTYYPDGDPKGSNDGFPGSLFGTGNNQTQYVSEISIPAPVISAGKNLAELPIATTLQGFHNIRGNLFRGVEGFSDYAGTLAKAGLAYLPRLGGQTTGKLYFAFGYHLQQVPQVEPTLHGSPEVSHGWIDLNLTSARPAGAWKIGDYINFVTSDYLFPIDPTWAQMYTRGKLLATGRFRDGGQGSQGPSLFAIGPWNEGNPPPPGASLDALPILAYTNILDPQTHTLNGYSHADDWTGGAWLVSGNRSAVTFAGTKASGKTWYGFQNGVVWPEEPPFPQPGPGERGWWADRFEAQIIFYDPADLAAVARGIIPSWQPQPYAVLSLAPYLYHVKSTQVRYQVGDIAFDAQHGFIYVMELLVDADKPIIHVFKIRES
ncbi:MAG TPA: hypothetical protein VIO61_05245 [Anaerolineaceae bacterium]